MKYAKLNSALFWAAVCLLLCHVEWTCGKSPVLETVPASNEELTAMIDSLPNVLGNDTCLKSESCAKEWIGRFNKVVQKMNERSAILEVTPYFASISSSSGQEWSTLTFFVKPVPIGFQHNRV